MTLTQTHAADSYGVLTEPTTLKIQRMLPGPIERVWAYLTDGELRRKWLAAGQMELMAGAPFELVWRNDELTDPPGKRPDGFGAEHRMQCRVIECEPSTRLVFTWGANAEVSFQLDGRGDRVLLTIVHKRVTGRDVLLNVSAGWHAHVDVLAAVLNQTKAAPHWDNWSALRDEYDDLFPA